PSPPSGKALRNRVSEGPNSFWSPSRGSCRTTNGPHKFPAGSRRCRVPSAVRRLWVGPRTAALGPPGPGAAPAPAPLHRPLLLFPAHLPEQVLKAGAVQVAVFPHRQVLGLGAVCQPVQQLGAVIAQGLKLRR